MKTPILALAPIFILATYSTQAEAIDFSTTSPERATVGILPGNPSEMPNFTYSIVLGVESEAFCAFPWSCGGGPIANLKTQDGVTWTQAPQLAARGGSFDLPNNKYTTGGRGSFGGITGTFKGTGGESDDTVKATYHISVPGGEAAQAGVFGLQFDPSGSFNVTLVNPFDEVLTVKQESLAFPTSSLIDDPFADLLFGESGITLGPEASLGRTLSFSFSDSTNEDFCFGAAGFLADGTSVATPLVCGDPRFLSSGTAVFQTPEPNMLSLFVTGVVGFVGYFRRRQRGERASAASS
jgi:hypothetical protein